MASIVACLAFLAFIGWVVRCLCGLYSQDNYAIGPFGDPLPNRSHRSWKEGDAIEATLGLATAYLLTDGIDDGGNWSEGEAGGIHNEPYEPYVESDSMETACEYYVGTEEAGAGLEGGEEGLLG